MIDSSDWLTLKEACLILKLCRQSVVSLIDNGEIYGTKKTGHWLIERSSIDAFLYDDKKSVELFRRSL